jgi:hypothetical protein
MTDPLLPARDAIVTASKKNARLILGGVAAATLVGGAVGGFFVGMNAGCGTACGFDVALFEAIGTWVGGVGVALVAGYYTLSSNAARRTEEAAAKLRKEEKAEAKRARQARALAVMCTLRYEPLGDTENGFRRVSIEFENKLDVPVFWPDIVLSDGTRLGGKDEQVFPGRSWGKDSQLAKLEIEAKYPTELAAREAINATGRDTVVFEFTIRGYRFARTGRKIVALGRVTDEQSTPRTTATVGGQP